MNPNTRQRRRLLLAMAGTAVVGWPAIGRAQAQAWPNKPIKIIVGFPPGGLTDAYARLFGEQVTAATGQTVIVENKPGAGAIIAIDAVAKSPPDGYTLLMTTTGAVWQNRVLYRKLPFDLDRDITPVAMFPSGPLVVAVPENVPARNFAEFIAWSMNNQTSMGSYAPASYPHMVAELMNRHEGTKVLTINYKGESPMWLDVATGQLQIAIGSFQAFATVQTRGVRPIGVTGMLRSPKLPDVPTLVEQGVSWPLVRLEGGLPLTAPAGVPEEVLRKLAQIAVDGAESPRSKQIRETFGIPDKAQGLDATRQMWREAAPVWIKMASELGIKLD